MLFDLNRYILDTHQVTELTPVLTRLLFNTPNLKLDLLPFEAINDMLSWLVGTNSKISMRKNYSRKIMIHRLNFHLKFQ